MKSKSSLVFSFCGDYEVDARAVARTINSLADLSSVIAEKEYPDVKFELSVKAVRPGSLEIEFVTLALAAETLLSPDNIEYAANMIGVLTTAFKVKRFLKGKLPKSRVESGETMIIHREDGSILEIPVKAGVYFVDNRIDRSVTNIIESAMVSSGVTGVAVESDERVEIPKDEFATCAVPINVEEQSNSITQIRRNETLFVRQAGFTEDLKWRFSGDQNITAAICDEEFMEKVQAATVNINAKTYIIADVQVTIYLKPDGTPSDSKPTYDILKVHEVHTVGEGQDRLDV